MVSRSPRRRSFRCSRAGGCGPGWRATGCWRGTGSSWSRRGSPSPGSWGSGRSPCCPGATRWSIWRRDGRAAGLMALADTVRPGAGQTVRELGEDGSHPVLLTGDHEAAARTIAGQLGLGAYQANCLPEDKLAWIGRSQAAGRQCVHGRGRDQRRPRPEKGLTRDLVMWGAISPWTPPTSCWSATSSGSSPPPPAGPADDADHTL